MIWSGGVGICFQTAEHQPGIYFSIGYQIPPGHNNLPTIYKFDQFGNQLDEFLILGDTIYQGGGRSIINMNDSTLLTGIVWNSINNFQQSNSEIIKIPES